MAGMVAWHMAVTNTRMPRCFDCWFDGLGGRSRAVECTRSRRRSRRSEHAGIGVGGGDAVECADADVEFGDGGAVCDGRSAVVPGAGDQREWVGGAGRECDFDGDRRECAHAERDIGCGGAGDVQLHGDGAGERYAAGEHDGERGVEQRECGGVLAESDSFDQHNGG